VSELGLRILRDFRKEVSSRLDMAGKEAWDLEDHVCDQIETRCGRVPRRHEARGEMTGMEAAEEAWVGLGTAFGHPVFGFRGAVFNGAVFNGVGGRFGTGEA
jgi:hypothetical protein